VSLLVVDASVGAKWFLPEDRESLTEQAAELLHRFEKNEVQFVVPDLFHVEIANAIWKAARTGRVSSEFANHALLLLTRRKISTVPARELLEGAFQIATIHARTVYDSLYVELAIQTRTQLITADERLANALAARFPVKWLGAI
jgi:predicted nucleic acid-binding protein